MLIFGTLPSGDFIALIVPLFIRTNDGHRKSIIYNCFMSELFHVLNRGVEKRELFLDNRDRARFVHDMYEFNRTSPAGNAYRSFAMMDIVGPSWTPEESRSDKTEKKLVTIHAWCLMGNHYHLLLSEKTDGGLSAFIRKLNVGYAKYFNERYKRSGTLFQGRTKKVLVEREAHFLHILHYIHLNPLDFLQETLTWRTGKIRNHKRALEHLESYRWSSLLDYCKQRNFPSVIDTDLFSEIFPQYKRSVTQYLRDLDTLPLNTTITLE